MKRFKLYKSSAHCILGFFFILTTLALLPVQPVFSCSRIVCETGNGTYITGRTMDWIDPKAQTSLWIFPRGMNRTGGDQKNAVKWTSKYGSIVASFYDIASADGMNEKGLVGNVLYLIETDYGDPAGKPTIKVGAWLQYYLDNFASVKEATKAMVDPNFAVIAPALPNGMEAAVHISLSDPTGDSAIFEFLEGKLVIHHGPEFNVMTNSPPYDQQLAINHYWEQIGGTRFLPGTIMAADRFVRLSYNLKASPKYKDSKLALASVFSQIRAISVPLGMTDESRPNLSMTLWRTVADHGKNIFYFETATMPAMCWIDLNKVDFAKDQKVKKIAISTDTDISGEVSALFKPAKPFKW